MPNTSSPCEIAHLRHRAAIGRGARQLLILLLAFLLLASFSGMARATGDEYRLGPQDRVRLKLYEWRATLDKVVECEAL
jgi:protein involved in polysaccharide export with SLBB domain